MLMLKIAKTGNELKLPMSFLLPLAFTAALQLAYSSVSALLH